MRLALADRKVIRGHDFRLEHHRDVVLEDRIALLEERHGLDDAAVDDLNPPVTTASGRR